VRSYHVYVVTVGRLGRVSASERLVQKGVLGRRRKRDLCAPLFRNPSPSGGMLDTPSDVRILELDSDRARSVTDFGSERFTVTPMAQVARGVMTFLRLGPGGRIGRHAAVRRQLFLVVAGDALVSGADGVEYALKPGHAALWDAGESHEARSLSGMMAIITEGDVRSFLVEESGTA
jgi:quercetin dioxygenase-like cupin family protein